MSAISQRPLDQEVAAAAVAAAPGAAGPLSGAHAILFTGTPQLSKLTLLEDLTVATFTGYAPLPLTWGPPVLDSTNRVCTFANEVHWTPTDAVAPNEITGYGVTNAAGDTLLFAEMFESAVGITGPLSFLGLVIQWVADNARPGSATVVT